MWTINRTRGHRTDILRKNRIPRTRVEPLTPRLRERPALAPSGYLQSRRDIGAAHFQGLKPISGTRFRSFRIYSSLLP